MLRHSTPITAATPYGGDLAAVSRIRRLVKAGAAPTITPEAEAAILGVAGSITASWEASIELESNRQRAGGDLSVWAWDEDFTGATPSIYVGLPPVTEADPNRRADHVWTSSRRSPTFPSAVADVSLTDTAYVVAATRAAGEEAAPISRFSLDAGFDAYLGDLCRATVIGANAAAVGGWTATAGTLATAATTESPTGRSFVWGANAAGSVLSAPLSPCAYATDTARPITLTAYLAGLTAGQSFRARVILADAAGAVLATVLGPVWTPSALVAGTALARFVATVTLPAVAGDVVRQMRWQLEHTAGADGVHVAAPELYAGHDRGPLGGMTAAVPRVGGGVGLLGAFGSRRRTNRVDVHGDARHGHVTAASVYDYTPRPPGVALASGASGGRLSLTYPEIESDGLIVRVEETSSGDGGDVWLTQIDTQLIRDVSSRVISAEVRGFRESGDTTSVGSFLTSMCFLELDNVDGALSPLRVESIDEGHRLELAARIHYAAEDLTLKMARRNRVTNPSHVTAGPMWQANNTEWTHAFESDATLRDGAPGALRVTRSADRPSTVAVSMYVAAAGLLDVKVRPGEVTALAVRVRAGAPNRRGITRVSYRDAAGTFIGASPGVYVPLVSGAYVTVTAPGHAAPAGADSALWAVDVDSSDGSTIPTGETTRLTRFLAEPVVSAGDRAGTYFDGDTADNVVDVHDWAGTPYLAGVESTLKRARVELRRNLLERPRLNVDVDGSGIADGWASYSAAGVVGPVYTVNADGQRIQSTSMAAGDRHGIVWDSGQTLPYALAPHTLSVEIREQTPASLPVRLYVDMVNAAGAITSTHASYVTGLGRQSMTFTPGDGSTRAVVYVWQENNTAGTVGPTAIRLALPVLEVAATVDAYFDGSSPATGAGLVDGLAYGWTGTVGASRSVQSRRAPYVEKIEAVPVGTFYSDAWDAPSSSITAKIEGRDLLGRVAGSDVRGRVLQGRTIEELLRLVALEALDLDEDSLDLRTPSTYTIPYAVPTGNLGTYVADLARSIAAYVSIDRLERLAVVQRDQDGVTSLATFTDANALLEVSTPLAVDAIRTVATVTGNPYVPGPSQEIYANGAPISLPAGFLTSGTTRMLLPYSASPALDAVVSVFTYTPPNAGGLDEVPVLTITDYGTFSDAVFDNEGVFTQDRTVTDLRLTGVPLEARPFVSGAENAAAIRRYGRRELKIDAPFVQTVAQARNVATAALDMYSGLGADGRRTQPAVELVALGLVLSEVGDVVTLSEAQSGVAGDHRIVAHVLEYDAGVLRSTASARAVRAAVTYHVADVHLSDDVAVLAF